MIRKVMAESQEPDYSWKPLKRIKFPKVGDFYAQGYGDEDNPIFTLYSSDHEELGDFYINQNTLHYVLLIRHDYPFL